MTKHLIECIALLKMELEKRFSSKIMEEYLVGKKKPTALTEEDSKLFGLYNKMYSQTIQESQDIPKAHAALLNYRADGQDEQKIKDQLLVIREAQMDI